VNKIYHDVVIWEDAKGRRPAYRDGKEFRYIGVDDKKIMSCYLRQLTDLQNSETINVASNVKMYMAQLVYRLVFFNDHESRDFDDLYAAILNIPFAQGLELVRLIKDKKTLLSSESQPDNFNFDGHTFYCALDFRATFRLNRDNCGTDIGCGKLPNPICKIVK
jgi:hypothetical protein